MPASLTVCPPVAAPPPRSSTESITWAGRMRWRRGEASQPTAGLLRRHPVSVTSLPGLARCPGPSRPPALLTVPLQASGRRSLAHPFPLGPWTGARGGPLSHGRPWAGRISESVSASAPARARMFGRKIPRVPGPRRTAALSPFAFIRRICAVLAGITGSATRDPIPLPTGRSPSSGCPI